MTPTVWLLIIALLGALVYFACSNGKEPRSTQGAEIGRIVFACATLILLWHLTTTGFR
jgi:hypothetical protein